MKTRLDFMATSIEARGRHAYYICTCENANANALDRYACYRDQTNKCFVYVVWRVVF